MPYIGLGNTVVKSGGVAAKPNGDPSGLTITIDSDTQITLNWTAGATNQDGAYVYISTNSGSTYSLKGTVLVLTQEVNGLT